MIWLKWRVIQIEAVDLAIKLSTLIIRAIDLYIVGLSGLSGLSGSSLWLGQHLFTQTSIFSCHRFCRHAARHSEHTKEEEEAEEEAKAEEEVVKYRLSSLDRSTDFF